MKFFVWIVILAFVSSTRAAESKDNEESKRIHVENLSVMSSYMSRHLRRDGSGLAQEAMVSLKRHAHEDERGLKARATSTKRAEHADTIRLVADQLAKHHRKAVEAPAAHKLNRAHLAMHSLSDTKARDDGRNPSDTTATASASATAAANMEQKQALQKFAAHMTGNADPVAARSAFVEGAAGIKTMKDTSESQVVRRTSDHAAAVLGKKLKDTKFKDVHQQLAQAMNQKFKSRHTERGKPMFAKEGEE